MKQLIIVRHAKTFPAEDDQKDIDRALDTKGLRQGPQMAARLFDRGVEIDAFVPSNAVRAKQTAEFFARQYGSVIEPEPLLYNAGPERFVEVIHGLDDSFSSVALFAHNPGITDFVNRLSKKRIDSMPTCGVFAVKADIARWTDFQTGRNEFWFFEEPKS